MTLPGREGEVGRILERWAAAVTGRGAFVFVGGESGIGKTTLVRAVAEQVGEQARLLWGACDPLTTPRPLGPLRDMASGFDGRVRELLATAAHSHQIHDAVLDELRATSSLVVIDDLHWADEGTVDLLRFLLRRIASSRTVVLGTFRDDEVATSRPLRRLLGDAARTPDAECFVLPPLGIDTIEAMVGDRPIDAGWLHEISGGNAFFVTELLDHPGDELPFTVRDAVLARTADLDQEARELLDLLACAPESVDDRMLPALGIGLPPLRALAEAGLIGRGPRGVAFRHEMARLAVADAIPPGGEIALHTRMIDALETVGDPDPAVAVHHARAAGDAERVLEYATAAGVAAARSGAHTEAVEFLRAAIDDGASAEPAQLARLHELLAKECYLTDRLPEALSASRRALRIREEMGDDVRVGAIHEALSVYEWYNADRPVAEDHVSTALDVLTDAGDAAHLGHAHAMKAYLAWQSNDLDAMRPHLERARELAAVAEDPTLTLRLAITDSVVAVAAGDHTGRARLLGIAEEGVDRFDDTYSVAFSNLAYLDVEQRRFDAAAEVLEVSIPLTIDHDVPICHVWQLGARARLALGRGDWDAAVADAETVLDAPSAPLARTWPHIVRGLVALRRIGDDGGDLDDAWALACRLGEPLRLLPAAAARVERSWLQADEPDDSVVDDALAVLDAYGSRPGVDWSAGNLAVWLRRTGVPVDTDRLLLAPPHRVTLEGAPDSAAEIWDELGARYERALALVDGGGTDEAFEGLEILDRIGAEYVAARVRRDLRDRGVAGIPRGPRAATLSNPAGLTARQLDVLGLVDAGMTNAEIAQRLFISAKTADHHVSAILAKLGVRSRREAGPAARAVGVTFSESA